MARHKIRHFGGVPFVYFEGELLPFLRPGSYRTDGDGYWVSRRHLELKRKEQAAQAREEKKAKRLIEGIRFGKGSGRAGGGRGAAHKAHHLKYVNNDTAPLDCPICYYRRMWALWLASDYGRWSNMWEGWAETQLVRRELLKMTPRERRLVRRDPLKMQLLKDDLVKKHPVEMEDLKDDLRSADVFFDTYMRKHRFEHKEDFCPFMSFGIAFVYERASTHESGIPTEFCSDQKRAATHEENSLPISVEL